MSEQSINYLLSLLPKYKNREKYILSKLRNLPLSNKSKRLFCMNCLHLFIADVNCKIQLDKILYKIKCSFCDYNIIENTNVLLENNLSKKNEKSLTFKDLFK
ncbi:hypothetical protein H311_01109 [Anncaliia algerae PRA109]|nr:hypothetical protein H311_02039 [Anncaliia algerae PRA109]KCZ77873.1 hypothetical protein H311_01109 [Anncaliia algerae PRA109]